MRPSENITQFGERVVDLCDFLLKKFETKDEDDNRLALMQLREEASDIASGRACKLLEDGPISLDGLATALR